VSWHGHRLGAVEGRRAPGFTPWFLEIVFRDIGQVGLHPWTDGVWGHGVLGEWGECGDLAPCGGWASDIVGVAHLMC
jgi:hypothetical protein